MPPSYLLGCYGRAYPPKARVQGRPAHAPSKSQNETDLHIIGVCVSVRGPLSIVCVLDKVDGAKMKAARLNLIDFNLFQF